ncbi:MAG: glycosyltransferase family 4 protein [Ignavibacteria bacterium]|nr:glycosyltransferase family 4 protein [Ignavibacteria bacterium]
MIAVLYRLLNRSKVIYTCNGVVRYENKELKEVSLFYRLKDSICERMIFSFSDRIIFPSANALELSKEYYKKAALKAEVIPNGIDEAFRLIPGNAPARANTGRTINAVFIYKNEMNDSGLKFLKEFLSGSESRIVVHIITNHKIEITGVHSEIKPVLPMNTEELAEFYHDKDVFFSLNDYDTFSISTAEAMAAGLIPVVTNQTGISSCIEHGVNGFTLNYGDTHSLSGIIKEIVTMDASKRLEMKRNASAIYDKLNWNAAAESYMHHYKQLAGDQND